MDPEIWSRIPEYWAHWGFEPWSGEGMEGVRRRVTFRKGGLLGEVACYCVWDHVLWRHRGKISEEEILRSARPERDVMSRRYLLVGEEEAPFRLRSFLWGLRGFVEVLRHRPGGKGHRKFADLVGLADAAEGYASGEIERGENPIGKAERAEF
jgi:hypothetical protein